MSTVKEPSCFDDELIDLIKPNNGYSEEVEEGGEHIVACSIIESKNLASLVDESGDTLLHIAAKYRNVEVIKYLIESGCDLNAKNSAGKTPIMLAVDDNNCYWNYSRVLSSAEILWESGASIHITDNDGISAARLLLSDKQLRNDGMLIVLFLKMIDRECDHDSERIAEKLLSIDCPLWRAVSLGNCEVIEHMIRRGCPVDSSHPRSEDTPLSRAVGFMDLKTVEILIKYGADVNKARKDGFKALGSYYSDYGCIQKPKILKILLNATVFEKNDDLLLNISALLMTGTRESIEVLLEYKSDILNMQYSDGASPLHLLVQNPNPDVTEAIRNRNFNVDVRDRFGQTPLFFATLSYESCSNSFKFLLDNGANVNATCHGQFTPLFSLLSKERLPKNELLKTIMIFLENDADIQMIGLYERDTDRESNPVRDIYGMDDMSILYKIGKYTNVGTVFTIIRNKKTFYMAKPILAHLAMLNELGNPITNRIHDDINSVHPMFENHFNSCTRKLKKMKNTIVNGKLTLFEILVDRKEQIDIRCINNHEKILSKLESLKKKCRSKYYYDYILRKRLSSIILKIKLKIKSASILSKLLGLSNNTNHIAVTEVIEYLDYQDLKILCEIED